MTGLGPPAASSDQEGSSFPPSLGGCASLRIRGPPAVGTVVAPEVAGTLPVADPALHVRVSQP